MSSFDVGVLICGDVKLRVFEACLDTWSCNCVSYFSVYIFTLILNLCFRSLH